MNRWQLVILGVALFAGSWAITELRLFWSDAADQAARGGGWSINVQFDRLFPGQPWVDMVFYNIGWIVMLFGFMVLGYLLRKR